MPTINAQGQTVYQGGEQIPVSQTLPGGGNVPAAPSPVPAVVPSIVSTTGVQNEFNDVSNQLDNFANTPDPYAAYFQNTVANEQAANQRGQDNAVSSATATAANAENKLNSNEAAEVSGLETRGETSGASRYLPDYQSGLVAGVKESFDQRYQLLDQQEKIAVANATNAKQNADVKVAQEQLAYAKELRAEKAKTLQDSQNMAWKQYAFTHLSTAQQAAADRSLKGSSEKPLVPGSITALNKTNPLINLTYGDTSKSAQDLIKKSQGLLDALNADFNDAQYVRNGKYTYDYLKNVLDNLPDGISRNGLLDQIKGRLEISNWKSAKEYGLTMAEYDALNK